MAEGAPSSFITHILLNPVPRYLLGTLSAILTIGAAPFSRLKLKLLHVLLCLGCLFVGLFYFVNNNNGEDTNNQDVIDGCVYWLNSNCFAGGIWPFGYARPALIRVLRGCMANASA